MRIYSAQLATTVHLPRDLLQKLDARPKALGVSRNRFIVQTLAERVDESVEWPEDFVTALRKPVSRGVAAAADEMQRIIESGRRSRAARVE
jgi:predicted transcriptional regulator